MNKVCTKCEESLDLSLFCKDSSRPDGLAYWCRPCQKDNTQTYIHTPEFKANLLKRNQNYYQQNKIAVKSRLKKYAGTLEGKYAAYKAAAKSRGIIFEITLKEFTSFWQKPCRFCGDEISTIGLDRTDSSKGYTISNLVSCCTPCNLMKLDSTQEEFKNRIFKIANKFAVSIKRPQRKV